jgi:predicted nuclease of predicted toxin-antitoxin system
MRLKLDEIIPEPALWASFLEADVDTTGDEGLNGAEDDLVFAAACRENRMLITFDLDFADTRRFVPGTHPGIVILRLTMPSRSSIISRLREVLKEVDLADWRGCTVIVSDRRVRVRTAGPE